MKSKKEELFKGLKSTLKKGTKEYNAKLKKAISVAINKLFDIDNAFGLFGIPDKVEDIAEALYRRFNCITQNQIDDAIEKKLEEYDKKRKSEPICPVCKSYEIEDCKSGNDVFGPGYRSWHTHYSCKVCGVMFDMVKESR